jgi:hypothetical protein
MSAARSKKQATQSRGITPALLFSQVQSTAAWALTAEAKNPAAVVLNDVEAVQKNWKNQADPVGHLRFMLAAHYTTVATYVPTDVDTSIREHAWSALSGEKLRLGVRVALEASQWPLAPISERVVHVDGEALSGHQGEWFSVLAGALGRALTLADQEAIELTSEWIDAEIAREARLIAFAQKQKDPKTLLSAATVVAHNLGDLSRVVDTWNPKFQSSQLGLRYHRLGFREDGAFSKVFAEVTELNKRWMALENHRFLTLRVPRALRRSRGLLLPIGPYFFDWGRMIGEAPSLSDPERAEVLLALLQMHARRTTEHGCLRAIAGMNQTVSGGVARLAKLLPSVDQSMLRLGGVVTALHQKETAFLKSFHTGI